MWGKHMLLLVHVCEVFCLSFLSICPFSTGHGIGCPSSNYGFWLPPWYPQTFVNDKYLPGVVGFSVVVVVVVVVVGSAKHNIY